MPDKLNQGNLPALSDRRALVSIEDLYKDITAAAEVNELNRLVNREPKQDWLREHPTAKRKTRNAEGREIEVPVLFMPIGIQEYLLTAIFQKWRVEVKEIQLVANTVVATVRLHYLDPITQTWDWQDGVGGAPIRTNKGASATDFSQVQNSAVQTAAPAAVSFAKKDAADNIGKLFGKDLNRDSSLDYSKMLDNTLPNVSQLPEGILKDLQTCDSAGLQAIREYSRGEDYEKNPAFKQAMYDAFKRIEEKRTQRLKEERERIAALGPAERNAAARLKPGLQSLYDESARPDEADNQ